MGGQSRLQFWWMLSLLLVQSNLWIQICRCSLWLCELRWPFSYWTGTLLVWLRSGYRPHSSHLFASPSISLNQRGGICSKFAKNGLQDDRNIGFHRPCYMNASLWNTWGWSWVRVSLNLSYSEISEILLFASGMKPRSPAGVSEKPEIPVVSIRQPGTRRQVGDPGSAAQFDSLIRY